MDTADSEATTGELAEGFRLSGMHAESLTRFARVYRAQTAAGEDIVVKRTPGDAGRTEALMRWTRSLDHAGIAVVIPAGLDVANPQEIHGEHWVVYPWIDGAPYTGTEGQIRQAGDYLGRMHAVEVPTQGMRTYSYPDSDYSEVVSDCRTLEGVLSSQGDTEAIEVIRELGRRWWQESLPGLKKHDDELPRTAVSSDFKANNLLYTEGGPVLVDPDNGGVEPRIFDLALALVLFHNEGDGAPGRLFTDSEWETFSRAYLRHVQLTDRERELWSAALDHMLWEEGTWVLEDNDAAAWADSRQRAFLLNLAHTTPESYPLPDESVA
ncbi:phosphotransferase enzyme family protein [Nesterenkonia ebinurensis]|uniref:phosphotransferase enzyme family protein n=1 Tax=Nesterenkonia ebinurensis TaxID=2608252 RepID=UPI00123CFBAB|nr:aminoglycoside phosphotransferase family protein [Nesterenkonia ebinurensis]